MDEPVGKMAVLANGDGEQGSPSARSRDIHILDIAALVLGRWKIVLGAVGTALLIAFIMLAVRPKTYTARTVLFVSQEPQGRAQLLAMQMALGGLGGTNSKQKLIDAILKSQSLKDTIVTRAVREEGIAAKKLVNRTVSKYTRIQSASSGSIVIDVTDREPRRAARIANLYPAALNEMVAGIGAEAAFHKQRFLEAQLAQARERLLQSEQRLLDFQEGQAVPQTEAQAERALEAAAELQQQIQQQEIRVARLGRTMTADNPEYRAALADLDALRAQLRRLTTGVGSNDASVFVPLRESPQLRMSAARLLREFDKDQEIYKSLMAAASEAQIEANNNLPVVSVIDPAELPGPTGGSWKLILTIWGIAGLLVGLTAVFLSEYVRRVRAAPESELLQDAWTRFKHDLTRLRLTRLPVARRRPRATQTPKAKARS